MSKRPGAVRRQGIRSRGAARRGAETQRDPTMMPTLYAHPFSSYCQKVLTALYENGTPFEYRVLAHDDPKPMQELTRLWPLKRFPVLVDAG
ncbi:glutathione S-transferase N-terminal domain-containing protein, partial [Burkholderia sp. E168m23]|uniref:glutathione S-transferase N-terminal domain-containing protein n=1 Tax=Burkholderia sp. E168m23 TaxID=1561200 RepID=UPI001F1EE4FC